MEDKDSLEEGGVEGGERVGTGELGKGPPGGEIRRRRKRGRSQERAGLTGGSEARERRLESRRGRSQYEEAWPGDLGAGLQNRDEAKGQEGGARKGAWPRKLVGGRGAWQGWGCKLPNLGVQH